MPVKSADKSFLFNIGEISVHILAVFFLTLNVSGLGLPFIPREIRPDLVIATIYYWSLYRPSMFGITYVFVLGLITDFVTGVPVGLNALGYVCVHWIVTSQRKFLVAQSYAVIWIGYILACLMCLSMQWAVFSLYHFNSADIHVPLMKLAVSIFVYPPITVLFIMLHKLMHHRIDK